MAGGSDQIPPFKPLKFPAVPNLLRKRGLIALSILWVIGLTGLDSFYRIRLIETATQVSFAENKKTPRDAIHGIPIRHVILPKSSLDSRWWILHADDLQNRLRIRATERDNAPHGREVHWSSPILWLLTGLNALTSSVSTESVSLWIGPILLMAAVAALSIGFLHRLSPGTFSFLILGFGTNVLITQAFRAGETDHHGLAAWAAASAVASFALAWTQEPKRANKSENQRLVVFSALSAALGLWISASSTLPVIAAIGLAGLLGRCITTKSMSHLSIHADLWRMWSRWGAGLSLIFYAVEYFPWHLGFRLEVNHPVYALAWLAGGELMSFLYRTPNRQIPDAFHSHPWSLFAILAGISLPPALAVLFPQTFLILNSFLSSLHAKYIVEFQGLLGSLSVFGSPIAYLQVLLWPVAALMIFLWIGSRLGWSSLRQETVIFSMLPAVVFSTLTLIQQRWLVSCQALWVVCVTLLLQTAVSRRLPFNWLVRATLAVFMLLSFVYFPLVRIQEDRRHEEDGGTIPKEWLQVILLRDISHRLLESMNGKIPTILSGPTASTDFAFFANAKVVGTLYWENLAGLQAAAELFSAFNPEDIKQQLVKRQVSHIVIPSWDSFGASYAKLNGTDSTNETGFLDEVAAGKTALPNWLRPLYYPIPHTLGLSGESVSILQVIPEQTHEEALLHNAYFQIDSGHVGKAYELAAQIPPKSKFYKQAEALMKEIRQVHPHRADGNTD
jgi:hypothetical protein